MLFLGGDVQICKYMSCSVTVYCYILIVAELLAFAFNLSRLFSRVK